VEGMRAAGLGWSVSRPARAEGREGGVEIGPVCCLAHAGRLNRGRGVATGGDWAKYPREIVRENKSFSFLSFKLLFK